MKYIQKLPNILYFILRFIIHTIILCWVMMVWIKTPQLVIVQNPPSLPVLSFLFLFKLIKRKAKVIIDVHNYGYTLMYKTKSKKMLQFCKWYEQYFVRKVADHALTVSENMKRDIIENWKVKRVRKASSRLPYATIKPTVRSSSHSPSRTSTIFSNLRTSFLGKATNTRCSQNALIWKYLPRIDSSTTITGQSSSLLQQLTQKTK